MLLSLVKILGDGQSMINYTFKGLSLNPIVNLIKPKQIFSICIKKHFFKLMSNFSYLSVTKNFCKYCKYSFSLELKIKITSKYTKKIFTYICFKNIID